MNLLSDFSNVLKTENVDGDSNFQVVILSKDKKFMWDITEASWCPLEYSGFVQDYEQGDSPSIFNDFTAENEDWDFYSIEDVVEFYMEPGNWDIFPEQQDKILAEFREKEPELVTVRVEYKAEVTISF